MWCVLSMWMLLDTCQQVISKWLATDQQSVSKWLGTVCWGFFQSVISWSKWWGTVQDLLVSSQQMVGDCLWRICGWKDTEPKALRDWLVISWQPNFVLELPAPNGTDWRQVPNCHHQKNTLWSFRMIYMKGIENDENISKVINQNDT